MGLFLMGCGDEEAASDEPCGAAEECGGASVAVSLGDDHTCALKRDELYCWGNNNGGQAADVVPTQLSSPARVAGAWKAVAAGEGYTCGARADGTLWCWGFLEPFGLAGDELCFRDGVSTECQRSPVQIGSGTDWTAVAAGPEHLCALRGSGTLWCWGRDYSGSLGLGEDVDEVAEPTQVGAETDWVAVRASRSNTCAIRRGGFLYCWGSNTLGDVGDGTSEHRYVPTTVVEPYGGWTDVLLGGYGTCGLKDDGSLHCWGGLFDDLVPLPTDTPKSKLVGGGRLAFALLEADGTASVFAHHQVPEEVEGVGSERFTKVARGIGKHLCLVADSGRIACFGENRMGQAGGTPTNDPANAVNWIELD